MNYRTPVLERKIKIEKSRYIYELVVEGYSDSDENDRFESIGCSVLSVCTYAGKEIESQQIKDEIEFQITSELNDILIEEGEVI